MSVEDFGKRPLLLRRGDVLEVTGWTSRTLRRAVDSGILTAVRMPGGKEVRYRRAEVEKLLVARLG